MIHGGREKRIGCMLFAGVGLIILGFFLFGAMLLIGLTSAASPLNGDRTILNLSSLPLILVVAGILISIGCLVRMWWIPSQQGRQGTVVEHPDMYVVSRFAMDRNQLMQFPTDSSFADELTFYVQLQWPDGRRAELRTRMETYFATGEGMTGTASIQGDWLGKFVPNGTPRRTESSY